MGNPGYGPPLTEWLWLSYEDPITDAMILEWLEAYDGHAMPKQGGRRRMQSMALEAGDAGRFDSAGTASPSSRPRDRGGGGAETAGVG